MATVAPANSKRMYSWWWDSHISPKNSKWLQENLTDMDVKVKQMIKLLEEDADSFARRAEMYYKKRPELMKLVEEFYRAYRALAERYDHATGVLRQAHRTMAEAFPNQVPLMLGDESPAGSASEGDPRTPDVSPIRRPFDPDELQKDASGMSHVVRRNGAFTEEFDTGTGKKGLKQFNDSLGSGGKARKGLNFQDAENQEWGVKNNGNHDLKAHVESEHLIKAELEISTLKDALSKLEAEKEAAHLQYQQTLERLSSLELEFSHTNELSKEVNEQARKAEEEVQSLKVVLAKLDNEREAGFVQCEQYEDKISNLEKTISQAQKDAAELEQRAGKAEIEGNSLKQDLARLEAEKESALLQHKQCLVKISDMEDKLLHAEEDARKSSERADKAEKEVENLKQTLAKLTEEKGAAAVQYLQCLERITSLECKLAVAQEETQKLKSEIDDGVTKFMDADERCLLLERSNQSMHSELESLSQKMSAQSEKLTEKQQELGQLWNSLQEEQLRFIEAETAFQTLQHLHSQSQDELRSLVAGFQKRSQMLEDLEACNQNLQNEVEQIKGENKGLNEINLSSALTIQDLQAEILQLREMIRKLETEVELRVDERNALQQEIYCLKEELNDLNKNHQAFLGQVESVGLSPDSFVSRVKDLLDENMQLREDCERDRGERVVLLEKLNTMDKLIEKNAFLENSLSDLNVELEGVRDKVKVLEESCQSLLGEKSSLVDVKSTLVFQLQIAIDNLNEVTEKNKSLEKSLLDAHSELEGLQVKSKGLEDSCLLLKNEKSDFAIAKESLTLQLDISQKSLESLNASYKELEEKHLRLEEERESMLHEVEGLRVCLSSEKQEHASLSQSSESQLAGMALQISKLQEEIHCKSYEYEAELDRAVNAQIQIFVLQESIQDFEEKNFSFLLEYQKLVETSKLSMKLISELEQENLEKQMEVKSLFDQTKVLREGLYHVLKTLDANQWNDDKAKEDKILLSLVLNKLQETQGFLFELQDENQKLVIENSLLVTLIRELQLEVANVMTAKNAVDQEFSAKCEQLLLFQTESEKLKEMNEELRLNLTEREQNEEAIKDELKNLQGQMFDLQVAHQNLQDEKCKVLDEQRSLMKSVSDLRVEKHSLEEEYLVIFAETLSQSILSLIFRDTITERSLALNELGDNLDKLLLENDNLKESVTVMKGKLDEIDAMEVEKAELIIMVEDLRCKYEGVEVIRADQATQITRLSGECDQWRQEVETARDTSQKLEFKLQILQGESQQAKCVIERLNDELQNRTKEVDVWESQAEALFIKLQISSFQAALLEGKIHELAEICVNLEDTNHSSATEIDQLKDRVSTMDVDNGELTAQTNVYAMAFISLKDSITTLEKHTLSHVTLHEDDNQEAKDALEVDVENHQHTSEEQSALLRTAPLDLVELQTRIKAIEKAIVEKERLLALENSNSNSKLEAAMRQIEELKSGISLLQSVGITKLANAYLNDKELGPGRQKHSHEISEEGSEVITKDIILDQISECSSYGISRRETLGSDDPMLAMWETANHDGSNNLNVGKSQKVPTAATEKKHTREHISRESFGEKELSIDKLEISKNFSGSRQEGNERKILERLDSDVQKLTNLETTVQDLKRKVEVAEKHRRGKSIEYDSVKEQLEESEEAITKLLDANRKLKKTVEDDSSSFDEKSALASDQAGVIRKRKISEQARRGSEKIGRLQLEVQKLQFLLAEFDDEKKNKAKVKSAERKTRVLLRDYLYGGARTGPRRKKGHFCSCVQPATKED